MPLIMVTGPAEKLTSRGTLDKGNTPATSRVTDLDDGWHVELSVNGFVRLEKGS